MKLFPFGKKKKKAGNKPVQNPGKNAGANSGVNKSKAGFTYGVGDLFRLKDSDDIVVVGRVSGAIHVGDVICLSNPGDDNISVNQSTVVALEKKDESGKYVQPQEAKDEPVFVRVANGAKITIKPGTVLHSREASMADVHSAYVNGIGDCYVARKQGVLTEEDLGIMSMTDLAETWRLLNFLMAKRTDIPKEVLQSTYAKIDVIAKALVGKLYDLDRVYVVYDKNTGEPHLYSRTYRRDNGYECTPPDIMVVSEAYHAVYANAYKGTQYELRRVENGENKKGIQDFLGYCFFWNGARGVEFTCPEAAVYYKQFMSEPDYSGMKEADIPVTNPDVECWQLLMAQLGEPKTEEEKLLYTLYYNFFCQAFPKGKYLVPMKLSDGAQADPKDAEDGKVTLEKGTTMGLAIQEGKDGRNAVRFYTDWKRFRMVYDDTWNGLVQTPDSMIESQDILLNMTEFSAAGSYISKEMYEEMKTRRIVRRVRDEIFRRLRFGQHLYKVRDFG